jgi:hypothetical protein
VLTAFSAEDSLFGFGNLWRCLPCSQSKEMIMNNGEISHDTQPKNNENFGKTQVD